jgi:hypothetical protein
MLYHYHSLQVRSKSAHSSRSRWASYSRLESLSMEPLEDRRMLTASMTYQEFLAGGVLYRTIDQAEISTAAPLQMATNATGVFDIQLEKSPALLANAAASAAFDLAAQTIESFFFDPITIVVDADVSVLPPGVIGSTGSEELPFDYDQLRNLLIGDAQEGESLPALLPTRAQLQTTLPDDPTNPFTITALGAVANRATLKALGVAETSLPGTVSQYNPSVIRDMRMSFSTEMPFDFDPTDGIGPNSIDFVGVAIHEIMHGLGFVSSVDDVDARISDSTFSRQVAPGPLDLFRLRPGAGAVDFTNAPRVMTPAGDAVTYDGVYNPVGFSIPGLTVGDAPMSTGKVNGDGNQASHWKSDDITHVTIGIMDPTTGDGQLDVVTATDLRALGLIGYDLIQPIPPVTLSVTGASQLEGDDGTTDFVFTVSASNSTIEAYTVAFTTLDNTATAGSDYQAVSGTLSFTPDGPLMQTVTVKVQGDLTIEPNEDFVFRLSDATGPASIRVAEALGVILNDDVEVSIGDVTVYEGHDGTRNAVFAITAYGAVNKNIVVSYTTLNGSASGAEDYLPRAGSAMLTPVNPTTNVTVPIVGDRISEGTETFTVLLTQSDGARIGDNTGVGTILDDDPLPSFYVNDVQITTTEAGNFAAVFTVGLDAPSGSTVTVNFATADQGAQAGIDYQGLVGVLTFAPGQRTRTIAVPITTGASYSPDKKFALSLSNPSNALLADATGVATIVFAGGPSNERIIDNGDAGYSRSLNGWTTLTNTLAYGLDYDYHAAGNGSGNASYTFTGLASGSYQVLAKWIPFSNRATNAPYTILNGATPVGTVLVNQQLAPAGEVSNGITWQSLGTFEVTNGTLMVRLNDNANGYVIADSIRLVPGGIGPQSPEINIAGSGQSIADGDVTSSVVDGTDFGVTSLNSDSVAHTFTVVNNGNAVLNLGGLPRVSITGAAAGDFLITTQPGASINPNGSTNFSIVFRPTAAGLRQATITIANNDSDEGPYSFTIQGTGEVVASPFGHNAGLPQDVNADERVSTSDVLILVNTLLRNNASPLTATALTATATPAAASPYYLDVSGDGRVSTSDLLMVVNYILRNSAAPQAAPAAATAEEAPAAAPLSASAVDAAFILFDDTADAAKTEVAPQVAAVQTAQAESRRVASDSAQLLTADTISAVLVDGDEGSEAEEWDLLALDV